MDEEEPKFESDEEIKGHDREGHELDKDLPGDLDDVRAAQAVQFESQNRRARQPPQAV